MKALLYFVLTLVVTLTACNGKSTSTPKRTQVLPYDSLVMPYEDDMFSLLLPQGWTWETDTFETWPMKHVIDSLKITSGIVEFFPPDYSFKIRLVKGASRWMFPNNPLSDVVTLTLLRASSDSTCIYISEVTDSISIDGSDACSVWSAYDFDGDTIIQYQYIVIKGKYDLYYLNGIFDYGDEKSSRLFHKILSTIKLKNQK